MANVFSVKSTSQQSYYRTSQQILETLLLFAISEDI